MSKLYFCDQINDEQCFTLSALKEMAADEGLTEIRVYIAKPMIGGGLYWCKIHHECGEVSDGDCGKSCDQYSPRNGKSGRCRHSGWCYEPVGERITVKIKPEGNQ